MFHWTDGPPELAAVAFGFGACPGRFRARDATRLAGAAPRPGSVGPVGVLGGTVAVRSDRGTGAEAGFFWAVADALVRAAPDFADAGPEGLRPPDAVAVFAGGCLADAAFVFDGPRPAEAEAEGFRPEEAEVEGLRPEEAEVEGFRPEEAEPDGLRLPDDEADFAGPRPPDAEFVRDGVRDFDGDRDDDVGRRLAEELDREGEREADELDRDGEREADEEREPPERPRWPKASAGPNASPTRPTITRTARYFIPTPCCRRSAREM